MITFMPMLMWVAALVGASASLYVAAQKLTLANIGRALIRWLFIFPLGTQAVLDFLTYGFLPQTMAEQFGWAPSPFEMQVAFANLGLGAASFYAAFAKRPARIAVALAVACYLVGSGLSLVNNILDGDDLAAGVAGAILLQNFLTPVAVLILLFLRPESEEVGASAAKSGRASAPQGMRPQPAPGAAPQLPALAPPTPQRQVFSQDQVFGQEEIFGQADTGYRQPASEYGRPQPYGSDGRYGQQDPLGQKLASGLQERAPWESSPQPAAPKSPSKTSSPTPARKPVPDALPRPSTPAPRAQPRPQPQSPPQPRYDPPRPSCDPPLPNFEPPQPRYDDFDQSLEDELERARRQLMEDLQKGRKPGSY